MNEKVSFYFAKFCRNFSPYLTPCSFTLSFREIFSDSGNFRENENFRKIAHTVRILLLHHKLNSTKQS
jgi:hypothetical protein